MTCFLTAATLTACEPKHVVTNLAPPAERLQCEPAGARPAIPAEAVIAWERITTVSQAKAAHEAYVASVRVREGVITKYILDTEGRLFVCSNNMQWLREWYKKTGTNG